MAQQTQIARAEVYWRSWLERFPTIEALAASSPADVLRAWQGLGYDRRALNLLRCARVVVAEHGGHLPDDVATLERLPGIGPYTARALMALAFGRRVGAVDVNVRRVVGRIAGGPTGHRGMTVGGLQAAADALVPPREPGRWTHALMDLGATTCRIRAPRCAECPARPWCRAAAAWASAGQEPGTSDMARTAGGLRATRERGAPFTTSRRWLRGRILDRLRSANGDAWTALDEPIGVHDPTAVHATVLALATEGMVELDGPMDRSPGGSLRARLPSR